MLILATRYGFRRVIVMIQVHVKDLKLGDVLMPACKAIDKIEPTKDSGGQFLTMRDLGDGHLTYGCYPDDTIVQIERGKR